MPMPEIPEDWEWSAWITADTVELTLLDHSGQIDSIHAVRHSIVPTPLALQQMAEEILTRKRVADSLSEHLGIQVRVQ